ncbi:MAG: carboxypeptidase-like regulatory domain-containing protein [Gammaproteobacteria bacterium]|nr:carboxypeptidase-like regulatory domain-containing protein [Gammaproteobacteria bacterium]
MMHPCDRSSEQRQRWECLLRTLSGSVLLLAMGCLLLPAGIHAQETEATPVRVNIEGVVLDEITGTPIAGAAVYLEDEDRGALTDVHGAFRIEGVPADSQTIVATQFGYWEVAAAVDVPEAGVNVEIELKPRPILLDGVTAVADNIDTMVRRLQTRRRSLPYQTRVFDQERLLRSAEPDVLEFLWRETGLGRRPCPLTVGMTMMGWQPSRGLGAWALPSQVSGALASHCIWRRGRIVSPRVYIDEIPAVSGLDALRNYPTTQIYALEVYSQGAEIRAYTYRFMQRMAEEPRALIALTLWP